jgi:hypothetical protein
MRVERRLGEYIRARKETVGLNKGAMGIGTRAVPRENRTPTLADAGIDKKLSSRAQKRAAARGEALGDDLNKGTGHLDADQGNHI